MGTEGSTYEENKLLSMGAQGVLQNSCNNRKQIFDYLRIRNCFLSKIKRQSVKNSSQTLPVIKSKNYTQTEKKQSDNMVSKPVAVPQTPALVPPAPLPRPLYGGVFTSFIKNAHAH